MRDFEGTTNYTDRQDVKCVRLAYPLIVAQVIVDMADYSRRYDVKVCLGEMQRVSFSPIAFAGVCQCVYVCICVCVWVCVYVYICLCARHIGGPQGNGLRYISNFSPSCPKTCWATL